MKKSICLLLTLGLAPCSWAAEEHADLDNVYVNLSDRGSLQRGARLFINYCLSCHSASYMRYNRMGADLGISEELVKEKLLFASDKVGDLMITTMPADGAKQWFGIVPPDLTLIARIRKPDWIYTFLRTFYRDESTPSGWNNVLRPNVAMPHVLYELQGIQVLKQKTENTESSQPNPADHGPGNNAEESFELIHPGTLSRAEYDGAISDLTNFLVYLAEPVKLHRYNIGVFVILFLLVLTVLFYFLKKEYWKDVH